MPQRTAVGRGAKTTPAIVPAERIDRAILIVRRQKVMLDSELAALYDVPVFRLNEAVKRNLNRFPRHFT